MTRYSDATNYILIYLTFSVFIQLNISLFKSIKRVYHFIDPPGNSEVQMQ